MSQTPLKYKEITYVQMIPSEVNYIVELIKSMPENGLMVEWGCGGSTLKWLETLTGNQRLISIEHTSMWYQKVNQVVQANFKDLGNRFIFINQPNRSEFTHGYGVASEENPVGLTKYIHPTDEIYDADIYFIDGIARSTVALSVFLKRKKKNSIVLIHDFIYRPEWYNVVGQFCNIELVDSLAILTLKE